MDASAPTLLEVKAAIAKLPRADRAMLRPWLLAHYDVRGYEERGFVGDRTGSGTRDDGTESSPEPASSR
jgi:hypothetical protein